MSGIRRWAARLLGCLLALALSVASAAGQDMPRLNSAADLDRVIAEAGATVTVVNYWATWCPPCRAELPEFKRLQNEFDGREVRVIGVSFDYDSAVLKRFLDRYPLGYPNYIGDSELMEELGVGVIPKTVIYSPAGNQVAVHEGEIKTEVVRSQIVRLLGHGAEDVN